MTDPGETYHTCHRTQMQGPMYESHRTIELLLPALPGGGGAGLGAVV